MGTGTCVGESGLDEPSAPAPAPPEGNGDHVERVDGVGIFIFEGPAIPIPPGTGNALVLGLLNALGGAEDVDGNDVTFMLNAAIFGISALALGFTSGECECECR